MSHVPPSLDDARTVRARTSLSSVTIYNLIRQGKFPKQIRIGTRSYWDSRLISAWIEERLAEGRAAATNTDKFAKLGKLSVAARREKRLEARA